MKQFASSKKATAIGALALLLWCLEPLAVSEIEGIPILELMSLLFACAFIVTSIKITIQKKWRIIVSQPLIVWILGTVFLCGSDFSYMLASKAAPIAHVDLIDYSWPCFVIIFVTLLPSEKFSLKNIVGALIGIFGVTVLVFNKSGSIIFYKDYSSGYLLAAYGAMLWGSYTAFSRYFSNAPVDMIGVYCGLGAIIFYLLHLIIDPETVVPNHKQIYIILFLGVVCTNIIYKLWDYGAKFGDIKLLSSVTYLARVLGMALLVYFDKEPLTYALVIAVFLSCLGVYIVNANLLFVQKWYTGLLNFAKSVFSKKSIKVLLN